MEKKKNIPDQDNDMKRLTSLLDTLLYLFESIFIVDRSTEEVKTLRICSKYTDNVERVEQERNFYRRIEHGIRHNIHADDREYVSRQFSKENIAKMLAVQSSFNFRYRIIGDKSPIYCACKITRVPDTPDYHSFVVGIRDIDAEMRSELKLREEDRLHVYASAFKADVSTYLVEHDDHEKVEDFVAQRLIEYFHCQHVIIHRADGVRRDWNVEGCDLMRSCEKCPNRYLRKEMVGHSIQSVVCDVAAENFKLPEGCPVLALLARRIFMGDGSYGNLIVAFLDGPHKFNETDLWVLQHAANVLSLSLQRSRRNRELVDERDRAIAAEKAKSFFFSTVSHDIRTPLNAIIGFSQMLKLGFDDKKERDKAIDSIIVSGKTLLQLINDVLDLSKLEAGRMEILPDPVNCRRLVEEIVESFRASNTRKELEVRMDVGAMPILLLDPQRVRQILFNLVGNAMKFTQRGYVEVRARYELGADETGTLFFEVRDTGCGISEEDQRKIASPYVQVGRTGRNGGTGLGLAICRELVTAMDGEIELSSKVGRGTTFFVTLPKVKLGERVARERLSATQQMKVVMPATPPQNVHRVLVVDDSQINLSVLKAMLQRIGLRNVVTAENGVEALRCLHDDNSIDFVLTDMWMPELDGMGLVKKIRENPAWKELPVYAVTADVEARNLSDDSGLTGILLKPITFEKLKTVFA